MFFVSVVRTALLFAAAAFVAPLPAFAATAPSALRLQAQAKRPPRLHLSGNAVTAAYKIVDLGTPSGAGVDTAPEAFNNTGQLVGYAQIQLANLSTREDCIVWTGARFVDMSGPHTNLLGCSPVSIGDLLSTTKTYTITGTVNMPYKDTALGFVTSGASTATAFAIAPFQTNSWSSVVAVNAAGYGYGTAWYTPPGSFSSTQPPFVYSAGRLAPLQPACATVRAGCLAFPFNEFAACPFGKCWMNESGTILGSDVATGFLELFSKGTTTALPLSATAPVTPVAMNESLQLAYWYSDANGEYAALYDTTKKLSTHLGVLAGTGCTTYVPISLNNKNAVLGYATGCADGNERVWIWDSVHRMRDLSPLIPASKYSSISVSGINDNGAILATLGIGANSDWGYLQPL